MLLIACIINALLTNYNELDILVMSYIHMLCYGWQVSVTDYRIKSVDHASVELIHVRPSEDLQASSSSEGGGNYTEYKPLRTPVRE